MDKINVPEMFGTLVFNDKVMKARLSDEIYASLKKTIDENVRLDDAVADASDKLEARIDASESILKKYSF